MKVSVLIPLYNQEKYIEDCILSVINQTYEDIEIIIIDDGSTDNSYDIVKSYLYDPRIKLIGQDNHGLGITRNRLIEAANSEFIFHLDSDDYITKDCIKTMVDIQKNKNSDIVFSNFMSVNDNKTILEKIKREHFDKVEDYKKHSFTGLGYKSVCNSLIRKRIYTDNNIEVPRVDYGEDWSVIYKLIYFAKVIDTSEKYTYYYRKNDDGMTGVNVNDLKIEKSIKDIIKIREDYLKFIQLYKIEDCYRGEIICSMIEVHNSIYSILIRNKKSMRWYKKKFLLRQDKIGLKIFKNGDKSLIRGIMIRKSVLFIKKIILLLNNLRKNS